MNHLSEQHIAALVLLQTLAEHTRKCRDGALCTRAPVLMKRLDVYTRYALTTRARKRFFRFAIDVLAESHPAGPAVGRSIMARLLPS